MFHYWLRNTLYATLIFLAAPWIVLRRLSTGRYREGWRDKFIGLPATTISSQAQQDSPLIWLHGVSVGEIQLLKPLVDELRGQSPKIRFAISTTTGTGMELARRLFGDSAILFYFPLDFSWAIRRTMRALQPSLIVLGELELWPNLLDIAHDWQIPVAVVNGRLSDRSFRGYRRLSIITEGMFSKLSLVLTQTETYAQRFMACGTPSARVRVSGSVKFDNVSFDRTAAEIEELRKLVGLSCGGTQGERVWVVGSTQSGEERAAVECYLRVRGEFPKLKLIVIPRHRERFERVADELHEVVTNWPEPVRIVKRSSLSEPIQQDDWDILLVDAIGELRWWWGTAEVAVVGGSFGKRGGQNMLEPAAYGINVGFGPNTSNFRDVVELLLAAQAAERIESLDALLPWLCDQLRDPAAGAQRGRNAQRLIESHQGGLDRTVSSLSELLALPHSGGMRRVA